LVAPVFGHLSVLQEGACFPSCPIISSDIRFLHYSPTAVLYYRLFPFPFFPSPYPFFALLFILFFLSCTARPASLCLFVRPSPSSVLRFSRALTYHFKFRGRSFPYFLLSRCRCGVLAPVPLLFSFIHFSLLLPRLYSSCIVFFMLISFLIQGLNFPDVGFFPLIFFLSAARPCPFPSRSSFSPSPLHWPGCIINLVVTAFFFVLILPTLFSVHSCCSLLRPLGFPVSPVLLISYLATSHALSFAGPPPLLSPLQCSLSAVSPLYAFCLPCVNAFSIIVLSFLPLVASFSLSSSDSSPFSLVHVLP